MLPKKYVQWISNQSGLHPSFEPSVPVQIGDYGSVDKKTGEFLSEGNIFDKKGGKLSLAEMLGIEIVENDAPIYHKIGSKSASIVELSPEAKCGYPGVNVSAAFDISFSKGGAAALIFVQGTLKTMKYEGRLKQSGFNLFSKSIAIVTRVWSAPTYVICISTKSEQKFNITLGASVPTPAAGLTAGGQFKTTFSDTVTGNYLQVGPPFDPNSKIGAKIFCPLFKLGRTSQEKLNSGLAFGMFMFNGPQTNGGSICSDDSQDCDDELTVVDSFGKQAFPSLGYSTTGTTNGTPYNSHKHSELEEFQYSWDDDEEEDEEEDEDKKEKDD
jgi:hypothetical protein